MSPFEVFIIPGLAFAGFAALSQHTDPETRGVRLGIAICAVVLITIAAISWALNHVSIR